MNDICPFCGDVIFFFEDAEVLNTGEVAHLDCIMFYEDDYYE